MTSRFAKKTWKTIKSASRNADLALSHFDSFYLKVYRDKWPSMRLGLLSPQKYCAVVNTFVDTDPLHRHMKEELGAINVENYYNKHLKSWTRHQMKQQLVGNKKMRRREMIAKEAGVAPETIDLKQIEVSDVSGLESGNESSGGHASAAEDLYEMFSDRCVDDDEQEFMNRASINVDLSHYVPSTEIIYEEQNVASESLYDMSQESPDQLPNVSTIDEMTLDMSGMLQAYTYPRNEWLRFDQPSMHKESGLMEYYLMDGASLLPVWALDVRVGDVCADYCCAPGGKALSLLMSLKPSHLLCNDVSSSRLNRIHKVLRQYVPNISYVRETLKTSQYDARKLNRPNTYDKILIDAPCTNDRHSATCYENNIFKADRTEERVALPMLQRDILVAGLTSLKPKGTLVYSTCSMSPIQNDGVVHSALSEMLQSDDHQSAQFAVVNLKEAFRPLRGLFKFHTQFKYGQQVVPFVCSNFGPLYISKIKRIA